MFDPLLLERYLHPEIKGNSKLYKGKSNGPCSLFSK
jgi:hypothetical protein